MAVTVEDEVTSLPSTFSITEPKFTATLSEYCALIVTDFSVIVLPLEGAIADITGFVISCFGKDIIKDQVAVATLPDVSLTVKETMYAPSVNVP